MDVSTLDPLSARIVIELELENLNEALNDRNASGRGGQVEGFQVLRAELMEELEVLNAQIEDDKSLQSEGISLVGIGSILRDANTATLDEIRHGNAAATKQTNGSNDAEDESSETPTARTSASVVEDGNVWEAEEVSTNPSSQMHLGDHCAKMRSLNYPQTWKSSIREKLEFGECHTGLEKFVKEDVQPIDIPHVLCVSCLCYVLTENSYELECEPEPHSYCGACLNRVFDIAMRSDTSLFPSRCCGKPIPVELRRERVSRNDIKEFDIRVEELSAKNPTNCFNMRCAGFIREKQIKATVGTCIHCGTKTCTVCKGAEHQKELCPQDGDTTLLKKEAKRRNWQQCGNCKNMVELSMGCYHMTCRCRYEFCYLCGVKWKGCVCPQIVEEQLIQRDNGAANGAAAPHPPHGEHEHNRDRERGAHCGVWSKLSSRGHAMHGKRPVVERGVCAGF